MLIPILLALAAPNCETSLGSVTDALRGKDLASASALLASIASECSGVSSYFELKGITDELSGNGVAAEEALRHAISLDPKSVRLKEQLGAAYLRHKKPAEAIDILQEAVALEPANPVANKYLIGAYVESGDWKRAAPLFDQVPEKLTDPVLVLWFAQTLIKTNQLPRLDHDLPPMNAALPPALLFSLGTLFAQNRLYDKAVAYLLRIPRDRADDAVYFNLGLAYSHLQAYEEARQNYFRAVDLHPEHVESYFRVGLDYASMGDARMALPWLFRAHEWAARRTDISYALVEHLIGLAYFDTAKQVLDEALATAPEDKLLSVADADLRQAKGDTEGALGSYRKVLGQANHFSPALIGFAKASAARGNLPEARTALQTALAADSTDAAANGEAGLLEAAQQNWEVALTYLHRAWSQDHSNVEVALGLSRVSRHLGHPAASLEALTPLTASLKESVAFHLELAQVYTQLHRVADAEAERKTSAQLQSQSRDGLKFERPRTYVH